MQNTTELGFGCMRLPMQKSGDTFVFQYDLINQIFDTFLEHGFSYFDTAYIYHRGAGEETVRKCLVERHSRSEFRLATKLPTANLKDAEDIPRIFSDQLDRCGVDYFDSYLLHNVNINDIDAAEKFDAFGFLKKLKDEGKILEAGMSFHDTPELFEKILERHADVLDFVQLQINYIDLDAPDIRGKELLRIAERYNKPVVVMEPCKGGTLAALPEEAEKLMAACSPEKSPASWAFRFAAAQKGVIRVLSGMNSMEMLMDNLQTFKNPEPLSEKEQSVLSDVIKLIKSSVTVPCTSCGYCVSYCMKQIPIPTYFTIYNSDMRTSRNWSSHAIYYAGASSGHGKAGECIRCGKCEKACPQHISIREELAKIALKYERK